MTQNFREAETALDRRAGVLTLVHLIEAAYPLTALVIRVKGNFQQFSAQLCRRCNTRHFGECKRGENDASLADNRDTMAYNCPQSQRNQPANQPQCSPPYSGFQHLELVSRQATVELSIIKRRIPVPGRAIPVHT